MIRKLELEALIGLPHIQQSAYILGIRPYMDHKTLIVGIKRRISYQSLSEILYIEPHPGIKSGRPSRQQTRRIIKSLERAGLIEIHSSDKHLILKCVLVNENNSVQNKADTKPTCYVDINPSLGGLKNIGLIDNSSTKASIEQIVEADTPLEEDNNYIYLLQKFDHFWSMYPEKKSKDRALLAFKSLNPDQALWTEITKALELQIHHHKDKSSNGMWVPPWKYPANWLMQRCWEDEVTLDEMKERNNAASKSNTRKESTGDMFWIPGADDEQETNVIAFPQFQ